MKTSTILLGGVALLGMTGIASAQTKVYITGSTAFRSTTVSTINSLLGVSAPTAYNGTNAGGPNVANWSGTYNSTPYLIKASFSGSGAGVQTVAAPTTANLTVRFLPDNASGANQPDVSAAGSTATADTTFPDMALSDVFQGTTPFHGRFSGVNYAQLTDRQIGVVAFTWAGSVGINTTHGAATTLTMTAQLAQKIFQGGVVPLSQFTGIVGADDNLAVFATGRNADSGTRLTAMAETNVGVTTTLNQYQPLDASGNPTLTATNQTISSLRQYPQSTINGITYPAGDGGEQSGGGLRVYMTDTMTTAAAQSQGDTTWTGGYLVTYLGMSDFNTVSPMGAVQLNYNGVTESQTGITEGSYTFWSYEHLVYKANLDGTGQPKLNFANGLVSLLAGLSSSSPIISPNVSLKDMQVQRFGDGGTVGSLNH